MSPVKGYAPAMEDRALVLKLLTFAVLTPMQAETFKLALATLELHGGSLIKSVRDHGYAILRAQGLIAPPQPKKPKAAPAHDPDMYSAKETAGTDLARKTLAKGRTPSGQMLKPPGR